MFSMALTVCVGLIVGLIGDSMYWKRAKKMMDQLSPGAEKPSPTSALPGACGPPADARWGYAILIIFFDLSINQIISAILSQLMGS